MSHKVYKGIRADLIVVCFEEKQPGELVLTPTPLEHCRQIMAKQFPFRQVTWIVAVVFIH